MIEVERLEKSYGFARALKGISFSVQKGEVVGFLGPNGAGKSTTMKILTGYLLPSGGQAAVGGFDVVEDSLEVRRRIGYLPESTPLYGDMRVDDYLMFCAEIRGVPRGRRKGAIQRAIDLCGLERVTGKDIVELSKGYRQRVGLAQAIVHEPPVLILDEPTAGLDPNQIVEVRKLIARLGAEYTVVLSTHILQEVEKSCSRVIIVNQGEIVADGSQEELIKSLPAGGLIACVRGPEAQVLSQCGELLPGCPVTVLERGANAVVYRLQVGSGSAPVEEAFARLVVKNGWDLLELKRERPTLEDVFRSLTLQAQLEAMHA
ncbi:MAG TPA: ATP-binding cassette domain-containing protein [Planctomycetota bacterium]|nr:ATP-binding cassette domain-containing protein [Planctomycetota bacterium]